MVSFNRSFIEKACFFQIIHKSKVMNVVPEIYVETVHYRDSCVPFAL